MIAPPLRGAGWVHGNGCCLTSAHRDTMLVANGTYVAIEIFAIDWLRLVDGAFFSGDGSEVTDYFAYGKRVHAVADGTVVSTKTDLPNAPVNTSSTGNPTVHGPEDYGGNRVVVDIGGGTYAVFCHLRPGSVALEPGDRVRTGDHIGRLGNSGQQHRSAPPLVHPGRTRHPDVQQPPVRDRPLHAGGHHLRGERDDRRDRPPV